MTNTDRYGWGIWLPDAKAWAELPPRMHKPSPYNCDLNPGLIEVARALDEQGIACEIKRIPPRELSVMKNQ